MVCGWVILLARSTLTDLLRNLCKTRFIRKPLGTAVNSDTLSIDESLFYAFAISLGVT